jgi:hypothetical protein
VSLIASRAIHVSFGSNRWSGRGTACPWRRNRGSRRRIAIPGGAIAIPRGAIAILRRGIERSGDGRAIARSESASPSEGITFPVQGIAFPCFGLAISWRGIACPSSEIAIPRSRKTISRTGDTMARERMGIAGLDLAPMGESRDVPTNLLWVENGGPQAISGGLCSARCASRSPAP